MQMEGVRIQKISVRAHNTRRNPGDDRRFHQRSCYPGRRQVPPQPYVGIEESKQGRTLV
jgi:hypothetical protein